MTQKCFEIVILTLNNCVTDTFYFNLLDYDLDM